MTQRLKIIFFINYLHYSVGFKKSFSITACETTKQAVGWVKEKIANKKVMLFIPLENNENV